MPEEKLTTIKISTTTRARLADYGKKSETFDQIVIRLLDEVEMCRRAEQGNAEGEPSTLPVVA